MGHNIMQIANDPRSEPMTLEQTLEYRKAKVEQELVDLNAALEVLAKNPGVVEAMNALRRVGCEY